MFKVVLSEKAKKHLKKLDIQAASVIIAWMRKNLENCTNPRIHGKALVGNKQGQWRYRVGQYRLLAEIKDEEIIIHVVAIGHRKNIYSS